VDFDRVRSSWPAILKRLEGVSRTAWLTVTAVQPLDYATESEVLTLGFASPQDVKSFKGSTPGPGPSDHLRTAIEQELGVRVKYLPKPLPSAALSDAAAPERVRTAPSSSGQSPSGQSAPQTPASPASVTEWAVASIPSSEQQPVALQPQFPVDPEPADVESEASAPQPPQDGAVDHDAPPLPDDADAPDDVDAPDDEPPYEPPMPPQQSAPPVVPQRSAPVTTERPAGGGVQRYGEAVIRQVLGATFVREEPYEAPTRFA